MNLAEQVGGIGVSVMVFKTAYETALDDMGVALANVSSRTARPLERAKDRIANVVVDNLFAAVIEH
jgi:hypothetical protein